MTAIAESGRTSPRLASSSAWIVLGKGIAIATTLAVNILVARSLTPAAAGAFFTLQSIAALGAVVGGLGMPQVVVRAVARGTSADTTTDVIRAHGSIARIAAVGATVAVLAGTVAAYVLVPDLPRTLVAASIVMWTIALVFQGVSSESFRGLHRYIAATATGGPTTGIAAVVVLGIWASAGAPGGAAGAALVVSAATLITMGWLFGRARASVIAYAPPARLDHDAPPPRAWLAYGLPLMAIQLTGGSLTLLGVIVLQAAGDSAGVALFATAVRVAALVGVPLLVVNQLIAPIVAAGHDGPNARSTAQLVQRAGTLATLTVALIFVPLAIAGESLLTLAFGGFYAAAHEPLLLLAAVHVVSAVAGSCGTVLAMTGNGPLSLHATLAGTVLSLVAGAGLAVNFGATGMAAGLLLGATLQNAWMSLACTRVVGIATHASLWSLFPRPSTNETA